MTNDKAGSKIETLSQLLEVKQLMTIQLAKMDCYTRRRLRCFDLLNYRYFLVDDRGQNPSTQSIFATDSPLDLM